MSDIESQLKEKKAKLAPQIKQLRAYRQKYNEMEVIYGEKKRAYDNTVMNLEQEKNKLEAEANKLWEDYKSEETKYHQQNINAHIFDALLKRLVNESKFLNTADKRLSREFKSYSESYNQKLKQ